MSSRAPLDSFMKFIIVESEWLNSCEFNKVVFFEEVAVCWMINTVARECWVSTGCRSEQDETRLHLARPSDPGHGTILSRSESPSGKCAKLHIVIASKNKDHRRDHSIFAFSRCGGITGLHVFARG